MDSFFIYADGGARGNPGPAGIGVVIQDANKKNIRTISRFIGEATNNQAEYQAVLAALLWFKENQGKNVEIHFCLDSELVVAQLSGKYKVKNEGLKPFFWQIRELIMDLGGKVTFEAIKRSFNKEADRLVNKAIDQNV